MGNLRWVIRTGQKILQEKTIRKYNDGKGKCDEIEVGEDVPLKEEKEGID